MSTLVKTYRVASGELKFEFVYSSLHGSLTDFSIVDMSPLRYGYDSDNSKSVSIYPANIDLVIDDLEGDNYANFRKFYSHYNAVYPFNHYDVLHLVISLNGEVIFKGLIDEVSNEYDSRSVKLSFVDGINRYKDAQVGNPALLQQLYSAGVIPRTPSLGSYAFAFGFAKLDYLTTTTIGQIVNSPGYFPGRIDVGDKDVRLELAIKQLIYVLRSDLNVEYQNDYKYGDEGVATGDMVGIDQLNIRRIMSNLLGRYIVIVKTAGRHNQIADVEPRAEYQAPDKFEIFYEDDTHLVYFHNWSGNYPLNINEKKWEKGLDEKKVSEILKTLAVNTFSYFGLKGSNTFFFRHKRYSSSATPLSGIRSMSKSLAIDKVNEVVIKDYYSDNYARKGNNYNIDDQSLEYKIPLNAFRTANGWEYRLNYFAGGQEKRVVHFYDQQLQIRDIPQELLSVAEWQSHKDHLNQYEFELAGINYHMDKTYSIDQDNYTGLVRPITIEKDLLEEVTQMTALEI